jgi:multidrug efflux system membrane fusion protein
VTVPGTRGSGKWWRSGGRVSFAALVAIAAAISIGSALWTGQPVAQTPAPPPQAAPGVPVTVARAVRQDFPVSLAGLGQVQAYNAVLVRARVDGTLMQFVPTEGQEVKQGDLIAVIDPRPYKAALDAAESKHAQDDATLANMRLDLARYTSLAKQDFASRQQVDTQVALVNQTLAALAGDDAAIEAAKLNLSFCYITSPIGGRVGLRQVDVGNLVHATDMTGIVSITQIQPISATFTLPQEDLPRVTAAMSHAATTHGKLPVLAYTGDDQTKLDTGELLTPDNAIDPTTGTIKLKAVFPNAAEQLWPNQFVNARLLVATLHDALTVPSVAVQHGPNGLYVYEVGPNSVVTRKPVEMSHDNGQTAVISKGIDATATVVIDGQSRLQEGVKVAASEAPKQAAVPPTSTGG